MPRRRVTPTMALRGAPVVPGEPDCAATSVEAAPRPYAARQQRRHRRRAKIRGLVRPCVTGPPDAGCPSGRSRTGSAYRSDIRDRPPMPDRGCRAIRRYPYGPSHAYPPPTPRHPDDRSGDGVGDGSVIRCCRRSGRGRRSSGTGSRRSGAGGCRRYRGLRHEQRPLHGQAPGPHPGDGVHARRQRIPRGLGVGVPRLLRPDLGTPQGPHASCGRQPRVRDHATRPPTSRTSGRRLARPGAAGTATTWARGTSSC